MNEPYNNVRGFYRAASLVWSQIQISFLSHLLLDILPVRIDDSLVYDLILI